MKFLKYLLFLILLVIIIGSIIIAVQPSDFNVSRTKTINAPQAVLYNQINDLKKWPSWSPWLEKEPDAKLTYGETTEGVGASYSWEGDILGNGSIKTIYSTQDSIAQHIYFGEDTTPSTIYWKLSPENNQTNVTWGITGTSSFFEKAYVLFNGGMDKIIGNDYERGLEKLDSVVTTSMNKFSISVNGITEYGGGFYLYKTTSATASNISNTMAEQYGALSNFLNKHNITPTGMPFTIYLEMNAENGNVIMSNAIPVKERIIVTGDSNILCGYMPKLKVLKTTLKGNYTHLGKAWEAARDYISENNLEPAEEYPFEIYTNDPGDYPNPADWVTEIYIPIK